jgi:small ligand-binding sensory domain FIST
MRWGSAGSDAPTLEQALERAAAGVRAAMGEGPIDFGVAFLSHHYADRYGDLPGLLSEALPCRVLVGCSAGGVIGGGREIEQRPGLSVTAACLPHVEVRPVRLDGSDLPDLDDPPGTWSDLLETPREPAPHFMVLADPFTFVVGSLREDEQALAARALFLGVAMNELVENPGPGDFLIRNLVGMDPETGALAIGENLRTGQTVQFHVRDSRSSAEDLELALASFRGGGGGADARGALLFSCLGRGVHLYGRADHDTDAFRRSLGDLPLGGFFCNGEIGPVGGASYLHGFTSSFGIFSPARN